MSIVLTRAFMLAGHPAVYVVRHLDAGVAVVTRP